jgi:Flp pilus assembly protein TadD
MAHALRTSPQSYTLLHAQCDFLLSKGNHEWALKLARQAVNCAPSEFVTWEKLTIVYTELEQYDAVCRIFVSSMDCITDILILGSTHAQLLSNVHL